MRIPTSKWEKFKVPIGSSSMAITKHEFNFEFDFTAEHLELPYLSAYLNSIGANFRHGANFATGGSTIRRQNESVFENGVSPFSLDIQIVQFHQFKNRTIDRYLEG